MLSQSRADHSFKVQCSHPLKRANLHHIWVRQMCPEPWTACCTTLWRAATPLRISPSQYGAVLPQQSLLHHPGEVEVPRAWDSMLCFSLRLVLADCKGPPRAPAPPLRTSIAMLSLMGSSTSAAISDQASVKDVGPEIYNLCTGEACTPARNGSQCCSRKYTQ